MNELLPTATPAEPRHFIIVGQGIAGTLLSYFLMKEKQNVLVVDHQHRSAASRAAAGIINPITGRRYVKSWRVDELLPVARQTYHELEALLQIKFYYERNVIRTFANAKEENDWLLHSLTPGYQQYVVDHADIGNYRGKTTPAFGYGEVRHGAQVNLPLLIQFYQNYLQQQGILLKETFDYERVIVKDAKVYYKDYIADQIIFCEGAHAKQNPFFNYLPLQGDKGEALVVRIPGADFTKMLKQQIFIVPLGADDLYWIGATYNPRYDNDLPSEAGKNYVLQHLQQLLRVPFEVVDHLAAIRPTVRDRRPLLGVHPQLPQLAIFNGLGTKGASLAPFFAQHFTRFLLGGQDLDATVQIQRFTK